MPALLITGPPGCGKTTVIRKILSTLDVRASGFYTQEIREQGRRTGFRLITLEGDEGILAHVDLKGSPRVGKYGLDLEVLESLGTASLEASTDLVVIDEIGPMEIKSSRFQKTVSDLIEGDRVVVGTIGRHRMPFLDFIREHSNVEVLHLSRENQAEAVSEVLRWVSEVMPST